MGTMTLLILVGIVACLLVGLWMVLYSMGRKSRASRVVCPRCRTANAEHARFCSQCGTPMAA